jgi:hypothetical protein
MAILDPLWEALGRFAEARKKTPALTGPVDADGKPVKVPDITGVYDAGTFVASTQPGFTTKDTSRNGRYADFESMDSGDIAALLDAVVRSALTFEEQGQFGFKLDGTKSNAAALLEQMIEFTQLRQKLPTIARDILKYGDAYAEALDGGDGVIERIQTYYPKQIYVSIDDQQKGNVTLYTQLNYANQAVATWQPGELIHWTWWPSDREPYSFKGLLDDLRSDWKNLQQLEQGMVTGRVSRAYPRLAHFIDVTNKTPADAQKSLLGYIRAVTRSLPIQTLSGIQQTTRQDLAPNEDYYFSTGYVSGQDGQLVPKLNKVEMHDPSLAGLAHIGDVEYVRRKMFSTIPGEVVGVGAPNLDPAAQQRSYARVVRRLQERLEAGLRELFTQTLVMAGIMPDTLVFVWPEVISGENWKFQEAEYKQALTEQVLIESTLYSRAFFLRQRGHTQEEIAQIQQEIVAEMTLLGPVLGPLRSLEPGEGPAAPDAPATGDGAAKQAAQGDQGARSSNRAGNPKVSDGPAADANRKAQTAPGAGGQNKKQ